MRPSMTSALALLALLTLLAAPLAAPLAAQQPVPSRPRLLVGAGISMAVENARSNYLQTRDGTITTGMSNGAGTSLTLGAAVRIPHAAVDLRVEGHYNQFTNKAVGSYEDPGWGTVYQATTDRAIGGSASLAWHMFPRFAASPYLLTGLGVYHSRLEREPQPGDPVRIRSGAPNWGYSFGAGMRLPALGQVFLVELRRHRTLDDEPISGRDFVPLTVGMEF